jgi:hypothetical protein
MMPWPIAVLFAVLGFSAVILGGLMVFVPRRFSYSSFLN